MPSLLDAFKQYINDAKPGGLLNPEVPPGGPTELAKGLLSFTPVVGDAISGYDAYQSAKQGNYGEAALNAVGLLPFVPAMGGVIKEVGRIPKKSVFPPSIDPSKFSNEMPELFGEGMSGSIKKMAYGDFFGRYSPAWGGEGKQFYAIGDDATELKNFMLDRMKKSEAGTVAAKNAKFNNSLMGKLQKEGFSANDFMPAKSTQSASEYYTHVPTGTKIRISDHNLPLHYDQPDIDLRSWMTLDEQVKAIKNVLGK